MKEKQILFVCGCPRSGTTAMWRLLTASPEIVMGVERYGVRIFTKECLTADLFEYDRFFSLTGGDTFYNDLESFSDYYIKARASYRGAPVVGDKIPKLYMRFHDIARAFPGAKIIFIFRNVFDVAASYKRRAEDKNDTTWRRDQGVAEAIKDWRSSLAAFRHRPAELDVLPVCYEDIFMEGIGLQELMDFVGVENGLQVQERFKNLRARSDQLETQRDRRLTGSELMQICADAPFGAYREVLEAARTESARPTAISGGN
jgi:hypothetical protein